MQQIIKAGAGASTAFVIQPGKQLTLSASGLAGDDVVVIEVVTLSRAPEFTGDSCCAVTAPDIQVIAFTPLLCAPGVARELTAESPYVVLDGPQLVTLRVRVIADPGALVEVFLHETDSDGCAEAWRCPAVAAPVEVSSLPCLEICELPVVELKKQVVDTQVVCGELWYIWSDGTKTTETLPACPPVYCPSLRLSCDGQPGYGFHLMDPKDPAATVEMAPCAGDTSTDSIWIYASAGPGHTIKIMDCDGVVIGYAANRSDCAPDCGCPETVINVNNTNNVAAPTVNVAAPEVTVTPVNNFTPTTNVAAPAVTNNFTPTTNVAAPAVTNNFTPTTNVAAPAVTNNFTPTTNVAAPEVNITQAAPNLVAQVIADDGTITSTLSDGSTVVSNPLPSC
jgi:hypothetical protein